MCQALEIGSWTQILEFSFSKLILFGHHFAFTWIFACNLSIPQAASARGTKCGVG
jgi:hypothetical protein